MHILTVGWNSSCVKASPILLMLKVSRGAHRQAHSPGPLLFREVRASPFNKVQIHFYGWFVGGVQVQTCIYGGEIGVRADVSMPWTSCQFIKGPHEGTRSTAVFPRPLELCKT